MSDVVREMLNSAKLRAVIYAMEHGGCKMLPAERQSVFSDIPAGVLKTNGFFMWMTGNKNTDKNITKLFAACMYILGDSALVFLSVSGKNKGLFVILPPGKIHFSHVKMFLKCIFSGLSLKTIFRFLKFQRFVNQSCSKYTGYHSWIILCFCSENESIGIKMLDPFLSWLDKSGEVVFCCSYSDEDLSAAEKYKFFEVSEFSPEPGISCRTLFRKYQKRKQARN